MKNRLNHLVRLLNKELGLFLSISFAVFVFVLFFEPFSLLHFDFQFRLLFVAGLAAIIFLFMFLVRILLPWLAGDSIHNDHEPAIPSYMSSFLILVLTSVAFSFYIFYIGLISLTFYLEFKIVVICLAPAVVLGLYDRILELKQQNEVLISEKKLMQKHLEKYEEDNMNKSIDFISENNAEDLSLLIRNVVYVKSADNYVEIVYLEDDQFKKKLIRNTLKNIEVQMKHYTNFIRSHRICIVNTHFIEKLVSNYTSYSLIIKGFDEQLPVSRQYLLKIREAI